MFYVYVPHLNSCLKYSNTFHSNVSELEHIVTHNARQKQSEASYPKKHFRMPFLLEIQVSAKVRLDQSYFTW